MSVNIVITMAGRGSRFYEAGYTVPKYEIPAHGKSLFDWSMLSLRNFLTTDCRVIFVCLEENNSADYVRRQSEAMGLRDVHVIEIGQVTDGQATSAYLAREFWRPEDPLLIYNIDTYVNPRALLPESIREGADGWVPCFQVPGDHWSFVKLGDDQWATDLAEKQRISDFASIGLYWFSRAEDYEKAYDRFFADSQNLVRGERYIAPLYRQLIAEGRKISITDLAVNDVHVLGTPAELNAFLELNQEDLLVN
ncbi:glycosyltransferase family 2 protein [Pseudomonas sp. B21-041]|jgi:dTDP-glucose pyrophosphorylase|uniref:Glycosyltransferase family 2 protein n=1 Tax=Pseudomonas germanica TaxID=2815720 RepID=A0ABX8YKI8_9PSED|nr:MULTISPECIES: glycosyltransferase family 2 protein [Pseudomonas]QYY80334.1 glycosyltransferase family 2 protein [Pseudomonas germanica]UVL33242.1 glycosyltransferase family 2 protein [Pseudomonas sp. B21-041]UVL98191.1 glycosyltransferase family 2 protein [Pseudomonas atacamensis]